MKKGIYFLVVLTAFSLASFAKTETVVNEDDFINDKVLLLSGGTWHTTPTVADIEKNGEMELILCEENGRIQVLRHDGTPVPGWEYPKGPRICSAPAVGDINGDGKLEIVVNGTHAWHWDGTLMEGWPVDEKTGSCFSPPALYDIKGDGKLEIINGSAIDHKVYVRDWKGNVLKGWPQPTGGEVRATPSVGDLFGNGKVEIVVGSWDFNLYVWNADGTLVKGWPKRFNQRFESQVVLADLNHNGKLDLIVKNGGTLYVLDGNGNPLPGWEGGKPSGSNSNPAVADIYGDGGLEIFGGDFGWYKQDGTRIDISSMPLGGYEDGVVAGDIDGDGRTEVLKTTRDKGTFAFHLDGSYASGWPRIEGGGDGCCTLADLDGRGNVDVILATQANRAYIWDCPGKFDPHTIQWPVNCANNMHTGVVSQIEWPGLKNPSRYQLTPIKQDLIKGDFNNAILKFQQIANSTKNNQYKLKALLSIARIYNFRLKEYDKAFNYYTKVILNNFDDKQILDAFTELCDLYAFKLKDKDKAKTVFQYTTEFYQNLIHHEIYRTADVKDRSLYLLAYAYHLLDEYDESLNLCQKIISGQENVRPEQIKDVRQFTNGNQKDTLWVSLAKTLTTYAQAGYFLNLELRKDIELSTSKKDLIYMDYVRKQTDWNLVISAQNANKMDFPCKTTIMTPQEEINFENYLKPKEVSKSGDISSLIWEESLPSTELGMLSINSHPFYITENILNENVKIVRNCERLDDEHQKMTISIKAPYQIHLRINAFQNGVSIENEGISPKHEWKTNDILVFSESPQTKFDCTNGQDFSFIMTVPKGYKLYYPDVNMGIEIKSNSKEGTEKGLNEYRGKTDDYNFLISSDKKFDMKRIEDSSNVRYHLTSMTE